LLKTVNQVDVEGMEITIPPKGERKPIQPRGEKAAGNSKSQAVNVEIRQIIAKDSRLVVMPKMSGKRPRIFDVASLRLESQEKTCL
jgi:hypothetical protein